VCAYAISAELNTNASARTSAERIACTSRSTQATAAQARRLSVVHI
jgi:hypothetical protein